MIEHLETGRLVASCNAFHGSSSPRHPDAGQLGWLVGDPEHRGKGLGTIVAAAVTNRLLAEGYANPFLGTEDFRTVAISIYLRLGWEPYLYAADMCQRWQAILSQSERGRLARRPGPRRA